MDCYAYGRAVFIYLIYHDFTRCVQLLVTPLNSAARGRVNAGDRHDKNVKMLRIRNPKKMMKLNTKERYYASQIYKVADRDENWVIAPLTAPLAYHAGPRRNLCARTSSSSR